MNQLKVSSKLKLPAILLTSAVIVLAVFCRGVAAQTARGEKAPFAGLASPAPALGAGVLEIETGLAITGLVAVPATARRGRSHILVAHGDAGLSLYNTEGELVWRLETPATLVGQYQNQIIVYRLADNVSHLDRYEVVLPGQPALVDSQSPSPVAATTIQRSAYAVLGPVQINDRQIHLGEHAIEFAQSVSAVAAVRFFPPLVGQLTLVVATEQGSISVHSLGAE